MTTFRAAVVRQPAGPASVEIVTLPAASPGPGQVRVRIEAAAVNPVDAGVVDGFFHSIGLINQPVHTGLGWDFAGTVIEAGAGVDLATGTRVAGIAPGLDRDFSALAEEILADASWAAVVPDNLTTAVAATVPLNALTADQLVGLLGDPSAAPSRRLLVTGAAGAVGAYVIGLALARGWEVTGLARAADEDYVRSLGADFTGELAGSRGAIADAAMLQDEAIPHVEDGGTFVGVRPAALPAADRGVVVHAVAVEPDPARLAALLDLVARGELSTRIAGELPLDGVVEALERVAKGGVRGRYVLRP